jgi:hypothetical protein
MGAVKNHFHDEICAQADEDRDRSQMDEEATTASSVGTPEGVNPNPGKPSSASEGEGT